MRDNGGVSEPENTADVERVSVRRAPKLGVFLVVGAAFGALVTLILTSLYPADPNVGFAATYAYFLVYGIPLGLLVGGVIGLLLDRRSLKRSREVEVAHERVD